MHQNHVPQREQAFPQSNPTPSTQKRTDCLFGFRNASTTSSPASSGIYDKTQQQSQNNSNHQKILIVEDNDELREYLRRTLSEQYNIQVCSNGKEALTIVKEYMPNLVISDIMMPEMDGLELCEHLKSELDYSHIRIVSYPEERHRDITYPHHPAHSTEYRQEYHRGTAKRSG